MQLTMQLITSFCLIGLLLFRVECCELHVDPSIDLKWHENSAIYQIYPRSFMDSNGDGIGDLNGITSRLEHLKDIGITALWLSPIYKSPQKDFGYDISDFKDITPDYGTLEDFDRLVAKAKRLGLRVMMDLVPNHTSDEHPWFQMSIKRIKPYDEYYIWVNATYDSYGNRKLPNNWLSPFTGTTWAWNEERGQFYYHAFVPGQPDLNYRNPKLRKEMEDVISFWIRRGLSGFRVDAIPFMFEDELLRDDPRSGLDVPSDSFDYVEHIYSKDLDEIYDVVKSWTQLLDRYSAANKDEKKILLMEAYAPFDKTMKYYEAGSEPFNFMFMNGDLSEQSRALDFKRFIDRWMNGMPPGNQANWVTGNHDNHRVGSRFGYDSNRADQLSMLGAVLPGILVIYNGDEIGMVDRDFTFEETLDPPACRAGPDRYSDISRDPERTPFQWDNSTSAGFSTNRTTWLPVNNNYKTLNLAAQNAVKVSHVKVFKALTKLKKQQAIKNATTEILMATENVLAVVRRLKGRDPVVLLINFSYNTVVIDFRSWLNVPECLTIYVSSVQSGMQWGQDVDTTNLALPGAATVILADENFIAEIGPA